MMPAVPALKTRQLSSEGGHRRVVLKCDGPGAWTLSSDPVRRFCDAEAALDYARRFNTTEMAVIEVWQGDEYFCCISQPARLKREFSVSGTTPATNEPQHRLTVVRYANRAATLLLVPAGTFFWLALAFCALAATLGWHIL